MLWLVFNRFPPEKGTNALFYFSGKYFNLTITLNTSPMIIANYLKVIKVTVDGPRDPRTKLRKLSELELRKILTSEFISAGENLRPRPFTFGCVPQPFDRATYQTPSFLTRSKAAVSGSVPTTSSIEEDSPSAGSPAKNNGSGTIKSKFLTLPSTPLTPLKRMERSLPWSDYDQARSKA